MAASSSLVSAFKSWQLCYWQWAGFLMIVTIFPLQFRTLHSLAFLSTISDVIVIICLGVILVVLVTSGRREDAVTTIWPPADVSFLEAYGSLSSFVFAFQGHSMFLEIMREMRDSRQVEAFVVAFCVFRFAFVV
jgi:amino acid permease